MEIKQYKDCEGTKVKLGDEIEKIGICNIIVPLGTVTHMRKEGFYVWVTTDKYPSGNIWGKFTRKIKKDDGR